jgi:hypothetical protein
MRTDAKVEMLWHSLRALKKRPKPKAGKMAKRSVIGGLTFSLLDVLSTKPIWIRKSFYTNLISFYFYSPEIKPERPPPPTESDVLFCGNLSDESTQESITEFFDKSGGVTSVRRPEGRPFAFIEFESMDAAAKALEELAD